MIAKINPFDSVEAKPWYTSKTLWGAAIGAAGFVAAFAGYSIDPDTQGVLIEQTTAFVSAGAILVSTVLVVFGRFKAQQPLRMRRTDEE